MASSSLLGQYGSIQGGSFAMDNITWKDSNRRAIENLWYLWSNDMCTMQTKRGNY